MNIELIAIQTAITVSAACGPGYLIYLGRKIWNLPIEGEDR